MFNRFNVISIFFIAFLVCSLMPVAAVSQESASGAVDHIVSELKNKDIFADKVFVPLDQLKDNTIVQVVSKKGYVSYIIYDGLVQTEDGKTIVLINNIPFQSQRYMTFEDFQKGYMGITIAIPDYKASTDVTNEIRYIQEKDLNERLKSLKKQQSSLKLSIFWLSRSKGYPVYKLIEGIIKEIAVTENQIRKVEDEMMDLGFIGA